MSIIVSNSSDIDKRLNPDFSSYQQRFGTLWGIALHRIPWTVLHSLYIELENGLTLPLQTAINFKFSLQPHITSHSMKNLAFHTLLKWNMITTNSHYTSLIHFPLKRLVECTFSTWERKSSCLEVWIFPRAPRTLRVVQCNSSENIIGNIRGWYKVLACLTRVCGGAPLQACCFPFVLGALWRPTPRRGPLNPALYCTLYNRSVLHVY